MILCVGPEGSGKTLLIKTLINSGKPVENKTIPTVGVNIYSISLPLRKRPIYIRELGGSMVPLWPSYYRGVSKVMYVIDAVNLVQLGAATLAFLDLFSHPLLIHAKVALILNKTDCPLPRSAKELFGVMRLDDAMRESGREVVVFEVSALTAKGLKPLLKWVKGEQTPPPKKE